MPFIPHTAAEAQLMLSEIGIETLDDLFDEIPAGLRGADLDEVPPGISELELMQLFRERASTNRALTCFAGAGAYDHHVPAAVWDLTTRGEFMTAYTPYQAEASQGTLQLIYEFQTMMTGLTGLDVANASVYDGASGLAEAVLMGLRANRKSRSRRVVMSSAVHPLYRQATRNIVAPQGADFDELPLTAQGTTELDGLLGGDEEPAVVVIQQPNVFGQLEAVDALSDWAADRHVILVAVVNPLSLAVLTPPGEWGTAGPDGGAAPGVDIACGDGQPLGIPMASGGPSFGFITCRQQHVRQLPGRIIGRTEDLDGQTGFTLTLQAREQHIRRGKATSNICTNQGLLVTAATIHMSLLGAAGLRQAALASLANTRALVQRLTAIDGVEPRFAAPGFHERVLTLPRRAADVVDALLDEGILAGVALGDYYDGFDDALLVCATEKRTAADIEAYGTALEALLR